jgi:phenylalanyl-tRNA synthetase beta subunit
MIISFLPLSFTWQDKLHQNLCRQRSLVAIGTHDLSKCRGPFTYEALPPSEISFVPLKQDRTFRADELMEVCRQRDCMHTHACPL